MPRRSPNSPSTVRAEREIEAMLDTAPGPEWSEFNPTGRKPFWKLHLEATKPNPITSLAFLFEPIFWGLLGSREPVGGLCDAGSDVASCNTSCYTFRVRRSCQRPGWFRPLQRTNYNERCREPSALALGLFDCGGGFRRVARLGGRGEDDRSLPDFRWEINIFGTASAIGMGHQPDRTSAQKAAEEVAKIYQTWRLFN